MAHNAAMQQNARPEAIMLEAISRRMLVEAQYNGKPCRLAPHHLFERHGDLFIGALNMDKAWRDDEERRLGVFKLIGLGAIELTDTAFEPIGVAPDALPRETDTLIFAV